MPQPIGDRQFVPSIVPPWTTMYVCSPVVMSLTWLLATSLGWAFEAQGSSAGDAADRRKSRTSQAIVRRRKRPNAFFIFTPG
jgi:hypothetical protein